MKPIHSRSSHFALIARALLMAALLGAFVLPAQAVNGYSRSPNDVKKKIEDLVRASGAQMVGVAFYDLASNHEVLINPDESFHAASTMKVPVMMEIYRQAASGRFSLDDRIAVNNDFISIADGSHFTVSANDDSEPTLYQKIGQTETIRELMRLMIVRSSNLATNILIARVSATRVMELMRELGAEKIRVLRGVEDGKAYERGLNNTTTARDLMILLRRIAARRAVSKEASDEMISVLLGQEFNEGIPAGLPKDARVAHKTGFITGIHHDAAIIYLPNHQPYVLVVLTRGLTDEKRAHTLMADISRTVYESITGSR
jgi:beta-lactamase class A